MRFSLPVIAVALLPFNATLAADTYTIDPDHTYVTFAVSHLGMSTMHGRINSTGGSFTLDMDAKTGSITVDLDPASIDTGQQKRDDHLRSPDFLNVVEFPEAGFASSSVSLTDTGGTVEGNLTLLGQSKPVTLTITGWNCGDHPFSKKPMCGFDAQTTIKRSDWGVNYGIPAIGEELTLFVELEGYKQ